MKSRIKYRDNTFKEYLGYTQEKNEGIYLNNKFNLYDGPSVQASSKREIGSLIVASLLLTRNLR